MRSGGSGIGCEGGNGANLSYVALHLAVEAAAQVGAGAYSAASSPDDGRDKGFDGAKILHKKSPYHLRGSLQCIWETPQNLLFAWQLANE
jgi:hypothetical protein